MITREEFFTPRLRPCLILRTTLLADNLHMTAHLAIAELESQTGIRHDALSLVVNSVECLSRILSYRHHEVAVGRTDFHGPGICHATRRSQQ